MTQTRTPPYCFECMITLVKDLFIYLGFYVAFNTVQVISRRVVERAKETSTYSSLGFCTVNCRPTASNYQLSHLRPRRESNPGLRGGRRECYHSATVAPLVKEDDFTTNIQSSNSKHHFCFSAGGYHMYFFPADSMCTDGFLFTAHFWSL